MTGEVVPPTTTKPLAPAKTMAPKAKH